MIHIEVWSDFSCPFCYIGKRSLDLALKDLAPEAQWQIQYRSFELDPNTSKSQKQSIHEMLAQKYQRSLDWARQMNERVTQMAAGVGLTYQMDRVIPTNSFDAHRLSHLAATKSLQNEAQEALFSAYFTEGKDIALVEVLREIGLGIGIPAADVHSLFESTVYQDEVREDEREAQELGVQGVPFFLFNRRLAVSGAQPIEVFKKALEQAASKS